MIKYNPNQWWSLIFHTYTKVIFKRTLPNLVVIFIYATTLTLIYEIFLSDVYNVGSEVHSLLGIVLGLFLVFRWNSAYDKWWEGRTIWGAMVNDCRNLALKLSAFMSPDNANRKKLAELIANYVTSMKDHLNEGVIMENLDLDAETMKQMAEKDHKPNFIASEIYRLINEDYKSGKITGEQLFLLDKEVKGLTDNIGACERIKNTPIPYSYSMYIKKFIFIYSVTLPLGFVNAFDYWTILITGFIFYFLITIELIAEEIEDPFGFDDNDLPTDELAVKIGANVKEILIG